MVGAVLPLALLCLLGPLAGCTSGGSHQRGGVAPSPSVTSASPLESPAIDPASQGLDVLVGTARITFSTRSSPVTVATSAGQSSQVAVDASGAIRVELTMRGKGGALFSLSGPAAVGSASHDHVSVLLPSSGVLVDTDQGNACDVRYTKAAETGVVGTARCDAESGAQRYTVSVTFQLH